MKDFIIESLDKLSTSDLRLVCVVICEFLAAQTREDNIVKEDL